MGVIEISGTKITLCHLIKGRQGSCSIALC